MEAGPEGQLEGPGRRGPGADAGRRGRRSRQRRGQGLQPSEAQAHRGPRHVGDPGEEDGQVDRDESRQQHAGQGQRSPPRTDAMADVRHQPGRRVGGQGSRPQGQAVRGVGRGQLPPCRGRCGQPTQAGRPGRGPEETGRRGEQHGRPGQGPREGEVDGQQRAGHRQGQRRPTEGGGRARQPLAPEEPVEPQPRQDRLEDEEPAHRHVAGERRIQDHGGQVQPPRLRIGGEWGAAQGVGVPRGDATGGQAAPHEAVVGEPEGQQVGLLGRDHPPERHVVQHREHGGDDEGGAGE